MQIDGLLGADTKKHKVTVSFVMAVCLSIRLPARKKLVPTGWISMKF
jgi:hypothetical protein